MYIVYFVVCMIFRYVCLIQPFEAARIQFKRFVAYVGILSICCRCCSSDLAWSIMLLRTLTREPPCKAATDQPWTHRNIQNVGTGPENSTSGAYHVAVWIGVVIQPAWEISGIQSPLSATQISVWFLCHAEISRLNVSPVEWADS